MAETKIVRTRNARKPKKRVDHVARLIHAVSNARSADHVLATMKMRPSHLRRVFGSRAFRNWYTLQKQLTKVVLARDAMENMGWIMSKLGALAEGGSQTAAMKACMLYFNNAMGDPFIHPSLPSGRTDVMMQSNGENEKAPLLGMAAMMRHVMGALACAPKSLPTDAGLQPQPQSQPQ
jgi:hypothetical protein